jgi:hypothetical protein
MFYAFTTKETQQSRMETCEKCPHLTVATKRCKLCGCFVAAKVMFKTAKCPANRWPE